MNKQELKQLDYNVYKLKYQKYTATKEKILYNQALTFYWLHQNDNKQAEHYLRKTIQLSNEARQLNTI